MQYDSLYHLIYFLFVKIWLDVYLMILFKKIQI